MALNLLLFIGLLNLFWGQMFTMASSTTGFSLELYPTAESWMDTDEDLFPDRGDQLWVRGGGATAIGTFMANVVPASSLSSQDYFYTFHQMGTFRGLCRLLDYKGECKNPWSGGGTDIQRPTSLDFAITTRDATEQDHLNYPDVQSYPFSAAPIAIIHNVVGLTEPLILSRNVLSKIFRKCNLADPVACQPDDIRYWNDSRIKALNPGQEDALDAAGEIRVLVRRDSAGISAAVKRALAIFEPAFHTQINLTGHDPDSNIWRSMGVELVYGLFSIGATVLSTSSSISYVSYDVSLYLQANMVGLVLEDTDPRSTAIFPNTESATRAMVERALDYGSDGTSPSRRIVEFSGGTNYLSWPVMMGAYIVVKHNSTRRHGTCDSRRELLKFSRFLFRDARVKALAELSGVVMLPDDALEDNLSHLEDELRCVNETTNEVIQVKTLLDAEKVFDLTLVTPPGLEAFSLILSNEFLAGLSTDSHLQIRQSIFQQFTNQNNSQVNTEANTAQIVINARALRLHDLDSTQTVFQTIVSQTKQTETESSIPLVALPIVLRYNWCGGIASITCTPQKINFPIDLLRAALNGTFLWWNDTRLINANPGVTFPEDLPVKLFHEGFWREVVLDALNVKLESEPASHTKFASWEMAYAFLQKTKGALLFTPSLRDESIVDDEQTTVAMVDGVFPSLTGLREFVDYAVPETPCLDSFQNCSESHFYRLATILDFSIPKMYDNCDQLRTVRDAGGFLGTVIETQETLVSQIVEFARFLLVFPKRQSTVAQAEASARHATELQLSQAIGDDSITRVLASINGLALFNRNKSKVLRAGFFRSLACSDGSQLVTESEQLNLIPSGLLYALSAGLGVFSVVLFIILGIWTYFNRHRKVIRYASPTFLYQILFGATICVSTLYPLSLQEYNFERSVGHDPAELAVLDAACMAIPWTYTIGYTIIFSALFLKTWRLVKIFNNPRMIKYHNLRDLDLYQFVAICIVWVVLLNIIWVFSDPLRWERVPIQLSPDRHTVISSVGLCTVEGDPWIAVAPLLVTTFVIMSFGLFLCYRSRNLPSDFQESSWISVCLVVQFQSLLYSLPVLAFTASNPMVTYICRVLFVFLNSTAAVLLIFLPKVWAVHGWNAGPSTNGSDSKNPKGSSKDGKVGVQGSSRPPSSHQNGFNNGSSFNTNTNLNFYNNVVISKDSQITTSKPGSFSTKREGSYQAEVHPPLMMIRPHTGSFDEENGNNNSSTSQKAQEE